MNINPDNVKTAFYIFYGFGAVIALVGLFLVKYGTTKKEPRSKRTTTAS